MEELLVRAAIRDELTAPVEGMKREVRGLREEIERTNRASVTGGKSLTSYGLGLGKITSAARVVTGSLLRVARVGMHAVTFAAAGAAFAIIKLGTDYEKSLNLFQAVTKATGTQMDQVRKKALALGADMKLPATSATDAASAMTELSKGGFDVQQSMAAARGTLQLAAAAQIDAAQAADIQSAALAQFELKGAAAGHVADLLANTANAAQGEITDMAVALRYIGPVAHAVGENIDNTSTAIGLLAKQGILGQKAGTGLRGTISSLLAPSEKAAGALAKLNVPAGKFTGLRDLTAQLEAARDTMSKGDFSRNVVKAFGRENLSAVNALASAGTTGWDAMAAAVTHAGGAQELAEARTKGLSGAWQGLQSQLETAAVIIYQKVEPGLEHIVRWLADRIPGAVNSSLAWIDKLDERWANLVDAISGGSNADIGSAINDFFGGNIPTGPLDKAVGMVHDLADIITGSLVPAFESFSPVLLAVISPLSLIDETLHLLAGHQRTVTTVLKIAIVAWIAYKAAAVAFLVYDKLVALWEFKRAAATGTATASTVAGRIAIVAITTAQKVMQSQLVLGLRIYAAEALAWIRKTAAVVASTVATTAASVATKAYAAAQWLLNAAMDANPITLIVIALAALALGVWYAYQHSEKFRDAVGKLGDGLAWLWHNVLEPVGKFLGKVLVGYLKLVGNVWLTFYELVVRAAGFFVNAILDGFGLIVHGAASAFGWIPGIGDNLKSADAAFTSFRDSVAEKFDQVADKIHGARDALNELGKTKTTVDVVINYTADQNRLSKIDRQLPGQYRAGGGWITGQGGPTADNQVVFASPTEFMMRSAVARQNRGLMEWLNANGGRPLSHADLAQAPIPREPVAAGNMAGELGPGPQPGSRLVIEAGGVQVQIQGGTDLSPETIQYAVAEGIAQWERDRQERR